MPKTKQKSSKKQKPQPIVVQNQVMAEVEQNAPSSSISSLSSSPKAQVAQLENVLTLANYGIFLQALVAMLGSLYYSTYGDPVANLMSGRFFPSSGGFVPCELCWYARILMYPLVAISGVALMKEDRRFTDYVLPLSVIGIFLEFYHYGLQMFNFPNPFRCTAANPCSALQVNYLGFITIPFLCLTAFVIITILAVVHVVANQKLTKIKLST